MMCLYCYDYDRDRHSCLPPSLKGFECLGEHSCELGPAENRDAHVFGLHERHARASRNDQFLWDLETARLRPSSTCLGERITSASMMSSWSKPRLSRVTCATISSRQWRSARPAESA